MTRVLVTGAAGAIGPSVVRELRRAGLLVRATVRSDGQAAALPPDLDVVVGDLTDPAMTDRAVAGVDGIVHLAGLVHRTKVPSLLADQYWAVNVEATQRLVTAAQRHSVRRIVLASTIAVYTTSLGEPLTEDAATGSSTVYAVTKLAAEQAVLSATRRDGQPLGTVLRLAAVYGPRIKGNYRRLVLALAGGRFIPIGSGQNRRTLVYVDDVGRAIHLALNHPSAAGRVFNVTDGETHTMEEIVETICQALGRRPPRFAIPAGLARVGVSLLEVAARASRRPSAINAQALDKYLEHLAVNGERLIRELGFRPDVSMGRGWRETIQSMRRTGELPVA